MMSWTTAAPLALCALCTFASAQVQPLFDFRTAESQARFYPMNDNVMGGLSEGGPSFEGARLILSGRTRLENNGGFSSVRSRGFEGSLEGQKGLILETVGDGRGYKLTLSTQRGRSGFGYWADVVIPEGGPSTILVPFDAFYPIAYGFRLPGPALDLSKVRGLGIICYDKLAGPFRLEVLSIGTYGGDPEAGADAPLAIAEPEGEQEAGTTPTEAKSPADPMEKRRTLIEQAVQRGARLFNEGQPASCAAVYRITLEALQSFDGGLTAAAQRQLREALSAREEADPRRLAWRLRRVLDQLYTDRNVERGVNL